VRAAATVILAVLAVAGCSSGQGPTSASSGTAATSTTTSPAPKDPVVKLDATTAKATYLSPVKLVVTDGSFASVQVSASGDGAGDDAELLGDVSADGASWLSEAPPRPAASYQVTASVKDAAGQLRTQTVNFAVEGVPDDQKLAFGVTPDDGQTVGIGQPVVVRFFTPVTKRAAVEKVLTVDARTPAGASVTGAWHWLNSQEVHWRPQAFWTPGTKVTLQMRIAGVQAATNRYGRKDYAETFTIGAAHTTEVDAVSHRVKVYRDGKLVDDWPSGTGRRGLETYSGTYIVLGKAPVVKMDSCSARITCDKKNPDYYDEKEYWATRITASGTFLHAADWDGLLGRANVSHGCVHLSGTNAKDFFQHAVVGDVVTVKRTGRGPQDRIKTQDPGLYDWNLSWSQWTAGSALR